MNDNDERVWIATIETYGPDPGDYEGWTSVHRTRHGAQKRLKQRAADMGIDLAAIDRGDDTESSYSLSHLRLED